MTERVIINGLGHYQVPNGEYYPSVTTIIGETKPETDKLALLRWRESVGEEKAMEGANRGTEVHALCENYFKQVSGKPAEEKVISALAAPYWENMKQLIQRVKPNRIEEFVYHDELKYAGRFDCYGSFDDRKGLVIDFKTSAKPKQREWINDYFIQATAYAMAIEHNLGLEVNGIGILLASPERPQIFTVEGGGMEEYRECWRQRLGMFYQNQGKDI